MAPPSQAGPRCPNPALFSPPYTTRLGGEPAAFFGISRPRPNSSSRKSRRGLPLSIRYLSWSQSLMTRQEDPELWRTCAAPNHLSRHFFVRGPGRVSVPALVWRGARQGRILTTAFCGSPSGCNPRPAFRSLNSSPGFTSHGFHQLSSYSGSLFNPNPPDSQASAKAT